ncbi:NADH-quinone oxidoreductase subunit C [Streptomyces sp. NPDC085481]|uniref:NADH-quinone oxidoreductase subunit C n=1 Tax=Streptomyces sp. NPDC085481 TaxID=3365727 RepID=UPI0037CE4272
MTANAYDTLPDAVQDVFGEEATAERAYDLLTVDVPTASWIAALEIARDKLGCTYFDWLSAVDEPGTGFRICAHVASLGRGHVRRLLLRTTVPHAAPSLPSAVAVYAGAAWHERETYEMFGVTFTDHPHLVHLLLPETFEGHPLRKDFVLAARVAKSWPGAKEPGESHDPNAPKRRQMLPPGVPDPNEWGPLKGQLPPAPARPTRAAAGADRPPRRTRTAAEGSATQPPATQPPAADAPATRPPTERRARTAAAGSASQRPQAPAAPGAEPGAQATPAPAPDAAAPPAGPRRSRSASAGSASQRAEADTGTDAVAAREQPAAPPRTRSSDAPWHHARPAFDEQQSAEAGAGAEAGDGADAGPGAEDQEPKAPPTGPEPAKGDAEAPPAKGDADADPDPNSPPTDPTDPAGGDPA